MINRIPSPFKFLDSYQKSDIKVFFGRSKETTELYNALSGVKHLMVYGPSGSGKTSLVECGLRNRFSNADWFALTIRKRADINASLFDAINTALSDKIVLDTDSKFPKDSSITFGAAVEKLFKERFQPIYLLFDQFEELLISGRAQEQKRFFENINTLISHPIPCRIMFIMREEFIGHLSEFESLFPSMLENRFRVEKMGRSHVKEVILQILEAPAYQSYYTIENSLGLAEKILSKLPDKKKEIELSHVQVFLNELWDRAQIEKKDKDIPALNSRLIKKTDNLETILESFLKKQMIELEIDYGKGVPLELLAAMISEKFTKLQISEAAIQVDLNHKKVVFIKPISGLLKELVSRRIVRIIKIDAETQFEISHDSLALVIGQNLTEEMKMREKAVDIYKMYEERQGLYSQDDLDYLRSFQLSLKYPAELHTRINQSISSLEKNRNAELNKTRKTLFIMRSLLFGVILAVIVASAFYLFMIKANQLTKEQKQFSKSVLLSYFATDQLNKNPTLAIRLTELAWQTDSSSLVSKKTLLNAFYGHQYGNKFFYTNNLNQHKNSILNAVFSPDSTSILTLSMDKMAIIWDVETGTVLDSLKGHTGTITSAIFSKNGDAILTTSRDNTAKLWNATTAKLLNSLEGHTHYVTSASFSPDGKTIVTASLDNTAMLWDVETGDITDTLQGHTEYIYSAVFSPKGKKIVTASKDATAMIWDVETGNLLHCLKGHTGTVTSAIFSKEGDTILTTSHDYTAKLWSTSTGKLLIDLQGHEGWVTSAVFSPDWNTVLTASRDKTALLWDVETGGIKDTLKGHKGYIYSAVFSPDGKTIVTASNDKTAKLWDVATGNLLGDLEGHTGSVFSALFSLDGKTIVTSSDDNTAKLWIAKPEKPLVDLEGHDGDISSAVFSPHGDKILTASDDETVKIWDVATGKMDSLIGHKDYVTSAVFSPDGDKILTASNDNTAMLWDVETGELLDSLIGHKDYVTSAVFSPDGDKIMTASNDNTAMLWEVETGDITDTLKVHTGTVTSAVFSPKGKKIVTASKDSTAIIWDAETGNVLHCLKGHTGPVTSAIFSKNGNKIVTASNDKMAMIWEVKTGNPLDTLEGHTGTVTSAVFSKDGDTILTTSRDYTVKLWSTSTGKLLIDLQGHEGWVSSAVFSPNGKTILTASDDKTAKLWDVEKGGLLADLKGHKDRVTAAVFSPDGKTIVTASEDHMVRLWLTPEGIIKWLSTEKGNINELTKQDLINLGIDFVKKE